MQPTLAADKMRSILGIFAVSTLMWGGLIGLAWSTRALF